MPAHEMPDKACPMAHKHTKCPSGYLEWHNWAEKKAKHHHQIKCPGCGRYCIWKRDKKAEVSE